MAEQMMQQQGEPDEQQPVGPNDMRDAMAGESEANQNPDAAKAQEVHERFVINAMRLASTSEYEKLMGLMQSGGDPAQNFARGLIFILEAVKEGLEAKDVVIPPQLWLTENGIVEQTARIVGLLGVSAGIQLDKAAIAEGSELAAEALAETDEVRKSQKMEQQKAPQGQPPQQPQPQGGLLSQAGGM